MNIFERWFEGELRRRGYDAEVWTNYLISLLDSHEDILPILTEMNMNLDSGELEIFYHQIMEYYDHPDQIPQILIEDLDNNVQSHEYQVNNNDVEDALDTRELDIDSHLISDTLDMLDEDYNNEIGENENEFETLEIIDYVSLAQELEYLISSSEPTVLFSTDSIMESLYYSYGVVEDSFNLLHYNYYMCGIAPPARPCRHLIQSGKCLRSDCMFDHSFSSKTCKFWLTTGCLSPECLFLHHLIFPESQLTGNSDATTLDSQDFPELISSKAPGSLHTVQPSISYKSALSKAPRNEERISSQNFNQNRSSKSVGSISSHSINQNFWVESG